jgi:hypothetical protein
MASSMFPVPRDAQFHGASDVKWFAGLAMQAILSKQGVPESEGAREEVALWAYRMGQAMAAADRRLNPSGAS